MSEPWPAPGWPPSLPSFYCLDDSLPAEWLTIKSLSACLVFWLEVLIGFHELPLPWVYWETDGNQANFGRGQACAGPASLPPSTPAPLPDVFFQTFGASTLCSGGQSLPAFWYVFLESFYLLSLSHSQEEMTLKASFSLLSRGICRVGVKLEMFPRGLINRSVLCVLRLMPAAQFRPECRFRIQTTCL